MNNVDTIFGSFKEEDLKSIRSGISEIVDSMTRQEREKEMIRDVIGALYDNYKVPKKIIRRMAKVHFKQTFQEELIEDKEFEALYTGVTEVK